MKDLFAQAGITGEKYSIALIVLIVLIAGLLKTVKELAATRRDCRFAETFLEKLKQYVESCGADGETYDWLVRRSDRMQKQIRRGELEEGFSPPSQHYYYDRCPIILNMLSELRTSLSYKTFPQAGNPAQYGNALSETVMHQVGILEDKSREQISHLVNPLVWLREGVRALLSLPVLACYWTGLIGEETLFRITRSRSYRSLSFFATAAGVSSAAIMATIGWRKFFELFRPLIAWIKSFVQGFSF